MSITYRVYKQESDMTPAKLEARCQSLGITTPHDVNYRPESWEGTLDVQWEAEKLDLCGVCVNLIIERSTIESLLSYADASDNKEFTNAISRVQELYTK